MGGSLLNTVAKYQDQRFNTSLTAGAQNGSLNRQEFVALNAEANGINAMQAQFAEGGINDREAAILRQRQERYDDQFQAYSHGDYHPGVRANNPAAARQLNQAGAIYDGIQSGSLTTGESNDLLREQRSIAQQGGRAANDGFSPLERWGLDRRLDQSASHIFEARHNWDRGPSPFPGCF